MGGDPQSNFYLPSKADRQKQVILVGSGPNWRCSMSKSDDGHMRTKNIKATNYIF